MNGTKCIREEKLNQEIVTYFKIGEITPLRSKKDCLTPFIVLCLQLCQFYDNHVMGVGMGLRGCGEGGGVDQI